MVNVCRYGKPFVLDMMDVNMLEPSKVNFNGVLPDLWESIMNKKILEED